MTVPGAARGSLPLAPPAYAQQYQNQLIRQLETIFNQLRNPGPFICAGDQSADSRAISGLQIIGIPLSTTGLKSGDVWGDISGAATVFVGTGSATNGVLNITAVTSGSLAIGRGVTGTGVSNGTKIVSILTGSGGVGTYQLNEAITFASTTITGFTSPALRILP